MTGRRHHYQKSKDALFFRKTSGNLSDQVHLVLRVVRASDKDVLKGCLGIDAESVSDRLDSLVSERALRVNESCLLMMLC